MSILRARLSGLALMPLAVVLGRRSRPPTPASSRTRLRTPDRDLSFGSGPIKVRIGGGRLFDESLADPGEHGGARSVPCAKPSRPWGRVDP